MDFQIGVAAIGFARQQRLDLVLVRAVGQRLQRRDGFGHHVLVTFGFRHFDQFGSVGLFRCNGTGRADGAVQPGPLPHDLLRQLGIVPQGRILDARVQLVKAAQRAVPVERLAQQGKRGVDAVNILQRFGAHGWSPKTRPKREGSLAVRPELVEGPSFLA